jgi:hypothetical protein
MPVDPPRDQQGRIVPHDHNEILDSYHVIRHTVPQELCPDGKTGKRRLSSGAFSESTGGGMSVDIEEWMKANGLGPLHFVTDPTHGAVRLNVGALRKSGLQVGWDPDDAHQYHGGVWGIGNGSGRRRRVQKIATTVKRVEGEDAIALETVPVFDGSDTATLFDMYILEDVTRTWIGSRRTISQCLNAFAAYCGGSSNADR